MLKFASPKIVFLGITILFPCLSLKFTPSCFLYNAYPLQSLTQTHTHTHTTLVSMKKESPVILMYTASEKKKIREKRKGGTFMMACHLTFSNVNRKESL